VSYRLLSVCWQKSEEERKTLLAVLMAVVTQCNKHKSRSVIFRSFAVAWTFMAKCHGPWAQTCVGKQRAVRASDFFAFLLLLLELCFPTCVHAMPFFYCRDNFVWLFADIFFDCIFLIVFFLICLQVFTYVYFRFGAVVIGIFICTVVLKVDVLIWWMCAYFWKEQRLCISMRIISTVSVSSNTIAVCIRNIFKLADSHQLQKWDLQIFFAVNIVHLYWLKNVACPWQFEILSQVEEPLYFHGAFLHM
jgi:hypothetical protein